LGATERQNPCSEPSKLALTLTLSLSPEQ
jgi:hypothetical protein